MMAALYAEFRKFLSVRSTYVVSAIALLITGFFAFWGIGYKGGPTFAPDMLQNATSEIVTIVGVFVGILAILLICHEYRYNTIGYTLTASNNRLKVMLAKFMVTGAYALLMTLIAIAWSIGLIMLGAKIAGNDIGSQSLELYSLLWKTIAYTVGSAWFGLLLGFLSRSLVFAIVGYFLIPTVESLLNALLKVSNNYLPTGAQNQILQTTSSPDIFTPLASLGVFVAYLAGMTVVAVVLFTRRDAN